MFRKIETNLKRKLFLHETKNLSFSSIRDSLENQVELLRKVPEPH